MDNPIVLDNIVSMREFFHKDHARLTGEKEKLEKALVLDPENKALRVEVADLGRKICEVNVGIAQVEFEVAKAVAQRKRNKEGMQTMMEYKAGLNDCKTLLALAEAKHAACSAACLDK